MPYLLIVFFTSSNQPLIISGSSQSFLWHSYVLPSFTFKAGVLFIKLLAYLTLIRGAFFALQIVSAIALIRLIVGDSPCASSLNMSLTSTSSSIGVNLLFFGVKSSLDALPRILSYKVVLGIL